MILFAYLTPYILNILNLSYSNEGYQPNWLMSILFLENYKMMFAEAMPNVSPLPVMWSLCIEEHFYLIWGVALTLIPLKRIPHLIIISIILSNLLRIIYIQYDIKDSDVFSNLDYFAFGSIPAYLLLFKKNVIIKIGNLNIYFKYFFVLLTLNLVFIIPNINLIFSQYIMPVIFSVLFSSIILFTLPDNNPLKISDSLWYSKLGIYTYGLYLFHTIIINLIIRITNTNFAITVLITLLLTILVSFVSYILFEKKFLALKNTIVK